MIADGGKTPDPVGARDLPWVVLQDPDPLAGADAGGRESEGAASQNDGAPSEPTPGIVAGPHRRRAVHPFPPGHTDLEVAPPESQVHMDAPADEHDGAPRSSPDREATPSSDHRPIPARPRRYREQAQVSIHPRRGRRGRISTLFSGTALPSVRGAKLPGLASAERSAGVKMEILN